MIYPNHKQVFPSTLLPHRLEEYVRPGLPPTTDRHAAKLVTGQQVYDAVTKAQKALGGQGNISPKYYVATCFHESGCVNEWDTEIATASCPEGFQSVGAFQIGPDEAKRFGFALADMLDLDKATQCMIKLAEANRQALRTYAKLAPNAPDPDCINAYLALAHNQGLGAAKATIQRYGMNWETYKQRNPGSRIIPYGNDCLTGGSHYPI